MNKAWKPKNTWFDWLSVLLGLGALLGVTLYAAFRWSAIPEKIPTHFNAAGEIDAFGGKEALLVPLVIAWVLYGLLSLVEAIPAVWNTGVEVTPENREAVFRIIKTMQSLLKAEIAMWFSYLILCSALCRGLSAFALPLGLFLIFGTLLWSLFRLYRTRPAHKK